MNYFRWATLKLFLMQNRKIKMKERKEPNGNKKIYYKKRNDISNGIESNLITVKKKRDEVRLGF